MLKLADAEHYWNELYISQHHDNFTAPKPFANMGERKVQNKCKSQSPFTTIEE